MKRTTPTGGFHGTSQSSGDDEASRHTTQPSKKSRQEATGDGSLDEVIDNVDTMMVDVSLEATPTKRKRGRPPGSGKKAVLASQPQVPPRHSEMDLEAEGNTLGSARGTSHSDSDVQAGPSTHSHRSTGFGEDTVVATPTKRKRGRPPGSTNKVKHTDANENTPKRPVGRPRKDPLATPTKSISRNVTADRSARRKSARTLIERQMMGQLSDEDDLDEDDALAQRIYGEDDSDDDVEAGPSLEVEVQTPIKRGRGRPRKDATVTRKRSLTPPQDLPPHETYFFQNRPGGIKTSANTLRDFPLLTHEDYYALIRKEPDNHREERATLEEIHADAFPQWRFELSEQFNICLFGYGSKHNLVMRFATFLWKKQDEDARTSGGEAGKIAIVKGHVSTVTFRDILSTLLKAILDDPVGHRLPAQPGDALDYVLALLPKAPSSSFPAITLIIHSLDSPRLSNSKTQALLARLVSHRMISLLATVDNPGAALIHDSSLRTSFNFVFHDTTTFAPYTTEIPAVVDDVHELFGRAGRRVGGKEGVAYVLKSLTPNARALYRILISELLAIMENGMDMDDRNQGFDEVGLEYRVLYEKAVADFVCTSEVALQSILKEFFDHQMVQSRKDALGTEMLSVGFRKEEMEGILEGLLE
jgi:origin recognition complex subunit 2